MLRDKQEVISLGWVISALISQIVVNIFIFMYSMLIWQIIMTGQKKIEITKLKKIVISSSETKL